MSGDYISRQLALAAFGLSEKSRKYGGDHSGYDTRMLYEIQDTLEDIPAADVREVVLCKDCLFGHLYIDAINGESGGCVECRNPNGLYRDVSPEWYCSASVRRKNDEEIH